MCGIAGGWLANESSSPLGRVADALTRISHRGPDDRGVAEWRSPEGGTILLGSTRLAVLDLSSAGHMPMTSDDGRYTLVYNGEITNYVELRDELIAGGRSFRSSGDTDVLLQAWDEWGAQALSRFEGMFAFAMLDRRARTLIIARDVFGIKPLFYRSAPGESFHFGSELPGLLELLPGRPTLDWQTAVDYLQWGVYDSSERTFVEGVRHLPPGHVLTVDLDGGVAGQPQRYWWPSVRREILSLDQATEAVREGFLRSVQRNLRSDVPVGIALSGGIDSSAITAAVRHLEPDFDLHTFSFVAPGFRQSEDAWIDLVASRTGAISHKVEASGQELLSDLDDMILAQGEPFGSTSIYAQYRVFRLAREHGVVVTLDGQGADEMFAGYDGYVAQRLRSLVERGRLVAAKRFLDHWGTWPHRSRRAGVLEAGAEFVPVRLARTLEAARSRPNPLFDHAALVDRGVSVRYPRLEVAGERGRRLPSFLRTRLTSRGLPALLRHGDRNSMRFSIESRVPFLDRELVAVALSLPEDYLVGPDGESKRILRRAMRGIVPDEVLDRRDKIGFATPESSWLTTFRSSALSPESAERIGFLHGTAAVEAASSDSAQERLGFGGNGLWRYLNLVRWVELLEVDAA
ncbi:asparagine synthase (glutamine-hydrolyzing) [Microbacterium sp. STN6]|uniref:asparagine synthase (glutamine-hydrolyzing) n=1 Tax=Microbacterium sp. STN6 TaxID=2995588 RepID=UPI002260D310|nr:asparagine synthase (glutamine-hydrolyzing) [Microbacterium sp. STN6]MCX7521046.1 asparagine synthase (glutamine-hydrolyzing) [Microbacterium sp. STN6]